MDVKQEKRIDDYWNIDGPRELSDPWTGFTQFTLLEEKAPDGGRLTHWTCGHSINSVIVAKKKSGIYVVREEINEETAYIQARSSMARAMEVNGKACEAEGEGKVV